MAKSIEIVKLSYPVNSYCFFHDLSDLMTFILFPKVSGELLSVQQYNSWLGKVRERWKG